jgi:putative membrane-bound dehydrogenase-like protein
MKPYSALLQTAFVACFLVSAPVQAQMSPEQELGTLRVPEGMEAVLFAAEPLITNPSAIDVDTHGRVWVAEIQWYRGAAKDPPADKIKVLEDTDGDGRADKVTTFAEGLFAPMSVCVAGDKVYVATSPDLWVYEDRNGDLKADGPPKKLLTGFGGRNHDHGAHSLVLGPDHKWWMAHGDEGFDVKGTDGSRIQFEWGAVLRGELDGSRLETVAVNFRNIYEVCSSPTTTTTAMKAFASAGSWMAATTAGSAARRSRGRSSMRAYRPECRIARPGIFAVISPASCRARW